MAEGDESLKPVTQFTSIIPHFWYDIIGQIVPGSYFIVGLYWLGFRDATFGTFIDKYLTKDSGDIRFLPLLIVFAFSAYFIGGVLGPFSYCLVQWPVRKWTKWTTIAIPPATLTLLEPTFGTMTAKDVESVKQQCTWIIWRRAPELAIIFSRWDAMALAARSTVLSSCLLLICCALYADCFGSQKFPLPILGILALLAIGVGNLKSFVHFRKNAVTARFEMVAVALDKKRA